jgi:hypothetical protein
VLQYVHNSIQWHKFGDLEKIVDLTRANDAKRKNSDGEQKALLEMDGSVKTQKDR